MSQENVDAVRRGLSAYYEQRDVEALLRELDPQVEWHGAVQEMLGGKATVYRGHAGVREWFRDSVEAFAEARVEIGEIRDLGDQVLAIGRFSVRGKASGAEAESPVGYLFDFRNGKLIRLRTYLDPEKALEAAGLRE